MLFVCLGHALVLIVHCHAQFVCVCLCVCVCVRVCVRACVCVPQRQSAPYFQKAVPGKTPLLSSRGSCFIIIQLQQSKKVIKKNLKQKTPCSVGHRMLVKAPVVAVCILLALLRDLR
jgi:hypothetical protein